MKNQRHHHPHVDSRQPRNNTSIGTNPPVFTWRPNGESLDFKLIIATDDKFENVFLSAQVIDPVYLPLKAFPLGKYYWKWCDANNESEIFQFSIGHQSVKLEVPPSDTWVPRNTHPILYFNQQQAKELKNQYQKGVLNNQNELKSEADLYLNESHHLAEPPFLEDSKKNYKKFFDVWYEVALSSRKFVAEAEILGLMFQVSGEKKYARAACERMVSLSKWDPFGSSHIDHNDEAHMSVIWNGSKVVDWVYEEFTKAELTAVINQFRLRGQITYDHLHNKGLYGVTKFDSHSGREIIFLAMLAMTFYDDIPESKKWLEWLRPVLCGIWPVWGKDDGAWAQGLSYATYVFMMTMFATSLKNMAHVDLYKRPFWLNHARWRQWCWPAYAEWIGFGDHTEKWDVTWKENINFIKIIAGQCETNEFDAYITNLQDELKNCSSPDNRKSININTQVFLLNALKGQNQIKSENTQLKVFPEVGWAAIRSEVNNNKEDVGLIFRSSPYGSISHSHANNNDMILHVGGKVITMPAGYYDGYGSPHHIHYTWHTKSHNCLTLSGAGQLIQNYDSVGYIINSFEDENITYFCGNADKSYSDRAKKCRRHVVYHKKNHYFVIVDEFISIEINSSAVEFNLHSWSKFKVDEEAKSFEVAREDSGIKGYFLFHFNSFFTLTEGWDPKPKIDEVRSQWWPMQYHMKFTTCGYSKKRNLTTVLLPFHQKLKAPVINTIRDGETEIAHVGNDIVWSNQLMVASTSGGGIISDALAVIKTNNTLYHIRENGVQKE